MFRRPKSVYSAIKSRLLHVICRLYCTTRGLREVFCVCNFALRSLKFTLALVTPENTQVSIYETLSPGIRLMRASVT